MPKILIVEDDPSVRDLLTEVFEPIGCEVIAASSGAEALRRVENDRPDLVVLDVELPGLSGFQVCAELRKRPAMASLPIVMLTGRRTDKDAKKGIDLGVDAYITKPFDYLELRKRVKILLKLP